MRHDATCNYHSFASTLSVYLTLLQLGCFLAGQHTKACRTKMCYLRYSPINHTFRSALRMTPDLLKAIKFFNILTVFELTKVIVSRKLCILVPCCTHSSFTPFVYWMLEFILWIDIKYASGEDDDICHGFYFTKRICVIANLVDCDNKTHHIFILWILSNVTPWINQIYYIICEMLNV